MNSLQRQNTISMTIIDDFEHQLQDIKETVKNASVTKNDALLRIQSTEQGIARHRQVTSAIDAALNPVETGDSTKPLLLVFLFITA